MTSLLKPGILVSAKTSIRGGVVYERKDLDVVDDETTLENADAESANVSRWETTRVILDPEEHERAAKARSKATSLIRRQCSVTSFGLLCPIANEPALDAAIAEARALADDFNRRATHSNVGVYVLKGRIAETDEEATRAIADEVKGLLDDMERGIQTLDVKSIRDAAARAKGVKDMLGDAQANDVAGAITAARKAAREIVKRVEKGGESAQIVLRDLRTGPIAKARFAFLEVGEADVEAEGGVLPSVSTQRFANLEGAGEGSTVAAGGE